jgi:hypothetical protein
MKCKTEGCIMRAFNRGICGRCKKNLPVITKVGRSEMNRADIKRIALMQVEKYKQHQKEWTHDDVRVFHLSYYNELEINRHKLRKQLIADGYYTLQ